MPALFIDKVTYRRRVYKNGCDLSRNAAFFVAPSTAFWSSQGNSGGLVFVERNGYNVLDYPQDVDFANWFLAASKNKRHFAKKITFCDEAQFYIRGHFNRGLFCGFLLNQLNVL